MKRLAPMIILMVSLWSCFSEVTPIKQNDFSLLIENRIKNRIDFNTKIDFMIGELGVIDKISKGAIDTYIWSDITVKTVRKSQLIIFMRTDNSRYWTPRGIRVGSTKKDVVRKYGQPYIDGGYYFSYSVFGESETSSISFLWKDDKVDEIVIAVGD